MRMQSLLVAAPPQVCEMATCDPRARAVAAAAGAADHSTRHGGHSDKERLVTVTCVVSNQPGQASNRAAGAWLGPTGRREAGAGVYVIRFQKLWCWYCRLGYR